MSRRPIAERLWSRVRKGGSAACWEWTGCRTKDGYGHIGSGGKSGLAVNAHRVAWETTRGPIPEGMSVLHHCDNPPCCNPAHLFLGTQADNVFDMVAKKRRRGPSREAIRRWSSKLTPEQARQIRLELAKGVPQRIVAERYGVSQATISNVNNGGTWPESGGPMRSRVDQRGERASHVKLTEADVREIRLRREPVKAQAARYGVSVPNIEAILYGRTWKHLL